MVIIFYFIWECSAFISSCGALWLALGRIDRACGALWQGGWGASTCVERGATTLGRIDRNEPPPTPYTPPHPPPHPLHTRRHTHSPPLPAPTPTPPKNKQKKPQTDIILLQIPFKVICLTSRWFKLQTTLSEQFSHYHSCFPEMTTRAVLWSPWMLCPTNLQPSAHLHGTK